MSNAGYVNVEESDPRIPIIFQTDSGNATATLNTIEFLGSGNTSTSAVGNIVTISSTVGGWNWQSVTSANNPVSLVSGRGYVAKGASQVVFVLPTTAAFGAGYKIVGYGNLWTIQQNAGQSISLGILTSTVGTGGSLTANKVSDQIELLCVTANTEFSEVGMQGSINIV